MSQQSPVSVLNGLFLKDDFLANDSVADAVVGELDWEIATIGNASTLTLENGEPGAHGILKLVTAATSDGDGEFLSLHPDTIVLGPQNGYFATKVRLDDQIASNEFIIGMTAASTEITPTDGIYVAAVSGVLTLHAASADHGDVSVAVTGVDSLTAGTTMVVTTFHDIQVLWGGAANAQGGPLSASIWVDGYFGGSLSNIAIDNDETMEPKIVHWNISGGALAVELDIDYYELFISRLG